MPHQIYPVPMPRVVVCGAALPFADDDIGPACVRDAGIRALWIVLMALAVHHIHGDSGACR